MNCAQVPVLPPLLAPLGGVHVVQGLQRLHLLLRPARTQVTTLTDLYSINDLKLTDLTSPGCGASLRRGRETRSPRGDVA